MGSGRKLSPKTTQNWSLPSAKTGKTLQIRDKNPNFQNTRHSCRRTRTKYGRSFGTNPSSYWMIWVVRESKSREVKEGKYNYQGKAPARRASRTVFPSPKSITSNFPSTVRILTINLNFPNWNPAKLPSSKSSRGAANSTRKPPTYRKTHRALLRSAFSTTTRATSPKTTRPPKFPL